eukprot:gene16910-18616_t
MEVSTLAANTVVSWVNGACGGTLKTNNGVITSPGYPENYPANSRCTWDIEVESGKKILISFKKLDIEEDAKCDYDALYIQEKRGRKYKSKLKVCGSKVPRPFKTTSNVARILFSSDESGEESGFKITWTAVSEKQECGGVFNATSGYISSPNHPGAYPNNAKCDYRIIVPFGHVVTLKIEQLDIELDTNCEFDALQIYDGASKKAHRLGKFCGNKISTSTLKPSGNKVLVSFTSDDSNGGRGFKISWTSKKLSAENNEGPRKCGTTKYSTRIVGGVYAKKGAFPWQAAIMWRAGISKDQQFCGGSLIDREWVLTAAHCFVNGAIPRYYKVKLGDHDLKSDDQSEQEFNVSAIMVHGGYNEITTDNDVALMRLSRKATINDHVNTICLPGLGDRIVPAGSRCKITGWGATEEHGSTSNILMEAEVPVVNRSVCAHDSIYGKKITQNMMCAGFSRGGIDTCQGDSGGPMQCRSEIDRSQWVLQGVTSWGRGCGRKMKYGVYAVVKNYLMWIRLITSISKQRPTSVPTTAMPILPKSELPKPPMPGSGGSSLPRPPMPGSGGSNLPRPPMPGAGGSSLPRPPMPGSSGSNLPRPPMPGAGGSSLPRPPMPGAGGSSLPRPPMPGSSGSSLPRPPMPGAGGSSPPRPPMPGSSGNDPPRRPMPGSSGNDPPRRPMPGSSGNDPPRRPMPGSSDNDPPRRPMPGSSSNDPPRLPMPGSSGNDPPRLPMPGSSSNDPPRRPMPGKGKYPA